MEETGALRPITFYRFMLYQAGCRYRASLMPKEKWTTPR